MNTFLEGSSEVPGGADLVHAPSKDVFGRVKLIKFLGEVLIRRAHSPFSVRRVHCVHNLGQCKGLPLEFVGTRKHFLVLVALSVLRVVILSNYCIALRFLKWIIIILRDRSTL